MGIGYVRSKKVVKKECERCRTVWDDNQIVEDKTVVLQGYGGDECPFCFAEWELTKIMKIPKLISRKTRAKIE